MPYGWIVTFVATTLVSGVLTGWVRRYALSNQILDVASDRSSHTGAVPRGGGLAMVVAFIGSLPVLAVFGRLGWVAALSIGLGSAAIALIGWLDDRSSLSPAKRAGVHVVASAGVVLALALAGPKHSGGFDLAAVQPWWLAIAIVLTAWMVNLYNFMDGIDGIAAGQGVFVSVAASFVIGVAVAPESAGLLAALGGACLGFLWWNRPPARIFMGDVGSGFLGFAFAGVALVVATESRAGVWVVPILFGAFFADTGVTLLRRMIGGEKWYLPHRSHAYQHLSRRFGSHLPATLSVILAGAFVSLPVALISVNSSDGTLQFVLPAFVVFWVAAAIALRSGVNEDKSHGG